MRAVVGRPVTLTLEVDDAEGQPTNADGDVLVSVVAGDGSTDIVTDATATDVDTTGLYTYVLASQTQLDTLDVTWTCEVDGQPETTYDQVRIVGNRLVSPQDVRRDPVLSKMTATPDGRQQLTEVLDGVEDLFADALGFPATLEGTRVDFDAHRGTFSESYAYGNVQAQPFTGIPGLGFGFGGDRLIVPSVNRPQDIYAMWVNDQSVQDDVLAQIRPGPGFLVWTGGRSWPSGNYRIWLSHGFKDPPGDLRWAAKKFAAYVAKTTPALGDQPRAIPERAATIMGDGGTIVFSVPSDDKPTGLPEVDAVLFRYAIADVV